MKFHQSLKWILASGCVLALGSISRASSVQCEAIFSQNTRYLKSADPAAFSQYIVENIRTIDENSIEAMIGDSRALYLGEVHPEITSKEFLEDTLAIFRAKGFTHLALEMLNSDQQTVLDQYVAGIKTRSELVVVLNETWGWPALSDYYVDVIDKALKQRMRIIAIDGRHKFTASVDPRSPDALGRERHMADIIHSVLSEPDVKVIALVGAQHARLSVRTNGGAIYQRDILEQNGIPTRALVDSLAMDLPSGRIYGELRDGKPVVGMPLREVMSSAKVETGFSYLPLRFPNTPVYDGILFLDSLASRWRP